MNTAVQAQIIINQIHPKVNDWNNRVLTNGGLQPIDKTIRAANIFYCSLVRDGLDAKVKMANFFTPESLSGALTPLIADVGNTLWGNLNFTIGDLSISGLKGNGTNKSLASNIISNSFATTGSGGGFLCIYISSGSIVNSCDIGCSDSATSNHRLYGYYGDTKSYFTAHSDATIASTSTGSSVTGWVGYICGSRFNTGKNIYRANSVNPHISSGSNTSLGGTVPITRPLSFFATNEAGTLSNWVTRALAFTAVGSSLSESDSSNLYNSIVLLRMNLGGGNV